MRKEAEVSIISKAAGCKALSKDSPPPLASKSKMVVRLCSV